MAFGAASGSTHHPERDPDRIPPPYPVVSFMVTGIEELVDALKARGVGFQPLGPPASPAWKENPSGDVMDFGPVKSAFLKDTEGNVIALNEIMP